MRSMSLYAYVTLVMTALFLGACAGRQPRVHIVPTVPVVTTSPPIVDAPVPPMKPTTVEVVPPIATNEIATAPAMDAITSVASIESPVPAIAWAKKPGAFVKGDKAAKRHMAGPTRVRPPIDSHASARAPTRTDAKAKKIAQLERENARLKAEQSALRDQIARLQSDRSDKPDPTAPAAINQNAPQASQDAAHSASDAKKTRPPPKRVRHREETSLFPHGVRKSASGEGHLTWFHIAAVFVAALALIAFFSFSKRNPKAPSPDEDDASQDDVSSGTHVYSPPGAPPLDWLDQMSPDQVIKLTTSMRKGSRSAGVHSAADPDQHTTTDASSASAAPPPPDNSGPTGSSDPPDKPDDAKGTIHIDPHYYDK